MSSGRTAIPPIPTGTADRFEGNPAGAGEKPRALDAQGSIGKQFTGTHEPFLSLESPGSRVG